MDAAFQELAYAMIRHKNFCPSGDEFGETMGLLPALAKVEEANPGSQFFDFSMCCDDTECEAIQAQKLIENFLNLVESRTQLNIYKSMNVVIAINDEQKQALLRMRQYFEMYSAIGVITTSQSPARSGDVISTRRKIFEIEHRGYNISFVEMEALNMIA